MTNPSYQCPVCGEYVEILPTTNKANMNCPWCNERLRLDVDYDDSVRDMTKLVTLGSHWDDKV